jgi:hypothetical protein
MPNVTLQKSPCGVTVRAAGITADGITLWRKTTLPAQHRAQDPHTVQWAGVASKEGILAIDTTLILYVAGRKAQRRHQPDTIAAQQ